MTVTDPRANADAARQWTMQLLRWLAWQEQEAQRWYDALVEQVAMGVVSCAQITRYNQHQERLYYWQAWVWDTFDPFFAVMRGHGLYVPADPPLPRLIGTVYKVGGGRRQQMLFEVSVPCSPQGMADVRALDIRGMPAGCYNRSETPTAPDPGPVWTGHLLDLSGAELGGWPAVALAVVAVVGIAVAGSYWAEPLRDAIGVIDGSTVARINAQMQDRQIEADRRRAELITACIREQLALYASGPAGPTPEQTAAIYAQCEAQAKIAIPDRAPPYATWGAGQVLIILGLAGAAVGTIYLVSRARGGGRDRDAA